MNPVYVFQLPFNGPKNLAIDQKIINRLKHNQPSTMEKNIEVFTVTR